MSSVFELCRTTYLVFLEIVGQVGNHDLSLAGNTILRRTALLALAGRGGLLCGGVLVGGKRFVRGFCQGSNLAGYICRGALSRGGVSQLDLVGALGSIGVLEWVSVGRLHHRLRNTHSTTTTSGTTATATATAAATGRGTAALLSTAGALGTAAGTLGVSLGSAGKLNGDLAVEDGLAIKLSNGTLSLRWCRKGNKGVADGARGARVGRDGCGLAVQRVRSGDCVMHTRPALTQGSP
jgi:hypothetical protein